jgi:uncharacterized protein
MAPNQRVYALGGVDESSRSVRVVASTKDAVMGGYYDAEKNEFIDRLEALESWKLDRFVQNNVILWAHDDCQLPVGWGTEVQETAGGLEMRVTFASAEQNPKAEEVWQAVRAKLVRGVSVGFTYGTETKEERDGKTVSVFRDNELFEVSICPVPADAGALTGFRAKDHVEAARSDAGDTDEHVRTDFMGSVSKFSRTQVGGLRVPARVTRTGVLQYRRRDGTIRRELRHPSEVFNTDSLASLHGATVTDLAHHKGLLGIHDWKDATLGHAEHVRRDGNFVEVDLVINDPTAIADIENGRLHDISCGYSCKLDAEPGVYEGEPYDVIQRRIRYNHVAVLPKGKGRAGTDVAMRFDARDIAECDVITTDPDTESTTMAEPNIQTKTLIRLDGKELMYGSPEHIKHIEDAHIADLLKAENAQKALVERCDKAEGKADAAEKKAKKAEEDDKEEEKSQKAKRRARERLLRRAARAMRAFTDAEDADEDKMDALEDELSELSDKDLMLKVVHCDAAYADDTEIDTKPEPYIEAVFDAVLKSGVTRSDGIDSVTKTLERVKRKDPGHKDPAAEGRSKMNQTARDAWKQPIGKVS